MCIEVCAQGLPDGRTCINSNRAFTCPVFVFYGKGVFQIAERQGQKGKGRLDCDTQSGCRSQIAKLSNIQLGQAGEAYARTFLENRGYQILAANYRCQFGEIDLIAEESHDLVFIEIKSRTGSAYGSGLESITPRKKQHILRVAWHYIVQHHKSNWSMRFDVMEVFFDYDGSPVKAELIQNAFVFDS